MRIVLANGTVLSKVLAVFTAVAFVFSLGGADMALAKSKKHTAKHAQSDKTASKSKAKSASKSSSAGKKAQAKAAPPRAKSDDEEGDDSDVRSGRWHTGAAAIIVDGNTGKILYEENADAQLHPASVTKVMTLFLLFEQLEAGRLRLDSQLPVSARAASQPPSKLSVRAGSSISVDDAIKALVTRSANDVAVVIAEALGGDEASFSDMMTRKAKQLGMTRSEFHNASGLPNPQQLTTARDLATLGLAIQDRFPKYYKYFATRSFAYRGETIPSHNHLMSRLEGVDGIKTGYTSASGFNLLTSVHRDGRFVVGVVLGGSSASSRDARMASLIANNFNRAYALNDGNRGGIGGLFAGQSVRAASAAPSDPVAPLPAPQRLAYAVDPMVTAAIPSRAPPQEATETGKPVAVKTLPVRRPSPVQTTSGFGAMGPSGPVPLPAPGVQGRAATEVAEAEIAPPGLVWGAPVSGGQNDAGGPVRTASSGPVALPARSATPAAGAGGTAPRPGWIIQIGTYKGEREAKTKLDKARTKARQPLVQAASYTEKVTKGSADLYRARFAGLSEKNAKEACRLLQRNDFECMTIRN